MPGPNAVAITKSGKYYYLLLEKGDGIVNSLFTDSIMNSNFLKETLGQLQTTSLADGWPEMMFKMNLLLRIFQEGQGTAGLILQDSAFRQQLIKNFAESGCQHIQTQ